MKSKLLVSLVDSLRKRGFFENNSEYTFVYVPQIQLSPYVAAILRHKRRKLPGEYLIVHPESNPMSRALLEYSNGCFGIHLREFNNSEFTIEDFFNMLVENGKSASALVCHSFSEGLNSEIISYFYKKNNTNFQWFFYSDGSRNNKESEFDTENKSKLFNNVLTSAANVSMLEFGFESASKLIDSSDISIKRLTIRYEWLDLAYSCCEFNISFDSEEMADVFSRIEIAKNSVFVLSRYWGREPYFFDSEENMYNAFVSSIKIACGEKNSIIYRADNRSNLDKKRLFDELLTDKRIKIVAELESLLVLDGVSLDAVLFEVLLNLDKSFLSKIEVFYSFDSSFPLVFISNKLKNTLADNVKIVVGFDANSVKNHGVADCYDVMKKRTVTVVFDVLNLGIFDVYDSYGSISSLSLERVVDYSYLEQRFEKNNGFFYLKKN